MTRKHLIIPDTQVHQSNNHFRGILLAHRVNNGCFDECFVSLDYLKERYD